MNDYLIVSKSFLCAHCPFTTLHLAELLANQKLFNKLFVSFNLIGLNPNLNSSIIGELQQRTHKNKYW